MKDLNVPEGYNTLMPYIIVKNAKGFFSYLQKVFEAKEKMMVMRDEDHIMHAEVNINGSVIMFTDSTEQYPPNTSGMFIYVDNADERYKIALAEGATSLMEPADQEYGRSCGVKDPFGNVWWMTTAK